MVWAPQMKWSHCSACKPSCVQRRDILEATRALPIIGDGDTGFGNALSVKRTVRGFASAGFAGILIEDQVATVIMSHTMLMLCANPS